MRWLLVSSIFDGEYTDRHRSVLTSAPDRHQFPQRHSCEYVLCLDGTLEAKECGG